MRPDLLRWVAKRLLGLVLFLTGIVLFGLVAVDVWTADPAGSFANITAVHVAWLLAGTVLVAVGHYVGTVSAVAGMAGGGAPGQVQDPRTPESVLAKYGFRQDPEDEDPEYAYREGDVYAVCDECGTENDPEYAYCSNCSAKL